MDNYEILSSIAENCHPKFIASVDGKRCVVGEVIDGVTYLTDEGKKLIEQQPDNKSSSPRKSKKVESSNSDSVPAGDEL